MSWSASVLSTVSSDTEPTVVITFDSAKYVFNVGENTSRTWLQNRRHWKKTKGVFLTSVGTERGSGLPGLLMFFADAGIPKVDIVGPRGLTHFLASMRTYLYRSSLAVNVTESELPSLESNPEPIFRDENLSVYGIPLNISATSEHPTLPAESIFCDDHGKRRRSSSPHSQSKRVRLTGELQSNSPPVGYSLRDQMRVSGFSPTSLRADMAHQWRRMTVESMFPRSVPPEAGSLAQSEMDARQKGDEREKGPIVTHDVVTDTLPAGPEPHSSKPTLQAREQQLPHFERDQEKSTLCYVCVGPRVRGRFDAVKAKALQIPRGPLMGKLTKGETITFLVNDGKGGQIERTVRPEECVGPSELSKVVIIMDVPSPEYIPSATAAFERSPFYKQFRSKTSEEYTVHAVFHICGKGVLEDSRYKEFLEGFADSVHHLIASREHTADPATFTSVAFNQLKLNQLDNEMFPIPKVELSPTKNLDAVPGLPPHTTGMLSNLRVDIRPPHAPTRDQLMEAEDNFHPILLSSAPPALSLPTSTAFEVAKQAVLAMDLSKRPPRPGDDVVIVPLGTCSASPSKYRNVSSTLIQIPNFGNILLDAGEGTWGQLARLFGNDPHCSAGVWQALRDVKCIFLSHMHGDHHIGLAKLLAMRRQLNPPPTEPLYVVGVRSLLLYLRELSEIEDLGLERENGAITILSDALHWRRTSSHGGRSQEPWLNIASARNNAKQMCQALGLEDFLTVDVRHRTKCYGAVMKHSEGWSIVFSADTMPSDNLVNAGKGATLLIHEATMGDDQVEMAAEKAHSTIGQAIDVGHRMNAENILLTHFSARYPKMPPSPKNPQSDGPVLALAFDHTRIRLGDMVKLRSYLPAIEQCFADFEDVEDEIIQ